MNNDDGNNEEQPKPDPRKRKRGRYKRNIEHFTTLDEKRSKTFLCICNYCQADYLTALARYKQRYYPPNQQPTTTRTGTSTTFDTTLTETPAPPPPPKKLPRYTRECEGHLRKCQAYRTFCQENNVTPSYSGQQDNNNNKNNKDHLHHIAKVRAAYFAVAARRSSSMGPPPSPPDEQLLAAYKAATAAVAHAATLTSGSHVDQGGGGGGGGATTATATAMGLYGGQHDDDNNNNNNDHLHHIAKVRTAYFALAAHHHSSSSMGPPPPPPDEQLLLAAYKAATAAVAHAATLTSGSHVDQGGGGGGGGGATTAAATPLHTAAAAKMSATATTPRSTAQKNPKSAKTPRLNPPTRKQAPPDPHFEKLLIEFLVDNDMPLQAVERGSFVRLMNAPSSSSSSVTGMAGHHHQRLMIPPYTKLRDVALKDRAKEALKAMQKNIQSELKHGHGPALIVKTHKTPILMANPTAPASTSSTLSQDKTTEEKPQEQQPLSPSHRLRLVHVIDSVTLKAGNASLALNVSKDDDSIKSSFLKQQDGMAIARVWEKILLNQDHHHHCNPAAAAATTPATSSAAAGDYFSYFLSDDTGKCARARNILALRHPSMLWLRCWVNQLHVMVHKLLKTAGEQQEQLKLYGEQSRFHKIFTQAVKASRTIESSSTATPTGISSSASKEESATTTVTVPLTLQLDAIVNSLYATKTGILAVHASDGWTSMQACFASQLCIRNACVALARDLSNIEQNDTDNDDGNKDESSSLAPSSRKETDFPRTLQVWKDTEYWKDLKSAELLIRPFCEASCLLQSPQANTLAHIMFMLLSLYANFQLYCEFHGKGYACGAVHSWRRLGELVMADIEERWEREDNPLFFLAFALHPSFRFIAVEMVKKSGERDGSWNSNRNPLSVSRLVAAAKFYYAKHKLYQAAAPSSSSVSADATVSPIKNELALLGKHIHQWLMGREFDGISPFLPQKDNAVEWWEENKFEYPQIARLAIFLLGAPIQATASCNDLFHEQQMGSMSGLSPPCSEQEQQKQEEHYMRSVIRDEMKHRYKDVDTKTASSLATATVAAAAAGGIGSGHPNNSTVNSNRRRDGIVDATQHKHIDSKHQQEGAKEDSSSVTQEQAPCESTTEGNDKTETAKAEETSKNDPDHADDDDNIDHDDDDGREEETEIEYWLRILESVLPEKADEETTVLDDDDDDGNNSVYHEAKEGGGRPKKDEDDMMDDEDDLEEEEKEEDSYEVATVPASELPPLPKYHIDDETTSYPHEGPKYFATKNYVRKDKYPLAKLLQGGVKLPSMMASIYKIDDS